MGAVHKLIHLASIGRYGTSVAWVVGTSVHCRSPMLEAMESFVTTQLKLMFILEENNLNLTQRYLGLALDGFMDFSLFFFRILLIFVVGCLPQIQKKTTGNEETLTCKAYNKHIVHHEGKKKWEDVGWVVGKDSVGDRYILKAKIVPPKEMGDLRIPDDAKVNNQKKKQPTFIHTVDSRNPAPLGMSTKPL